MMLSFTFKAKEIPEVAMWKKLAKSSKDKLSSRFEMPKVRSFSFTLGSKDKHEIELTLSKTIIIKVLAWDVVIQIKKSDI